MNPQTKKEVNSKVWYRVLRVLGWFMFASAIIVPLITGGRLFDVFVSAVVWAIILFVLRYSIIFIVYGQEGVRFVTPNMTKLQVENERRQIFIIILFGLIAFWIIIANLHK